MKITELDLHSPEPSKFQRLQSRKFTIELDGVQLLALAIAGWNIAGRGAARNAFSGADGLIHKVPKDINSLASKISREGPFESGTSTLLFKDDILEDKLK